ncbi:MAG: ornithine cyclodeaminase family protein [Chloroflexi bacterium]|nr:ornithine cyclodeaminase family protein [Chloroflexota bacterium]
MLTLPPLRYLAAREVQECLPSVEAAIELAGSTLHGLSHGEAEIPPKLGVHPRPGALLHAMPAWLKSSDVVGMKWVSAFPNNRAAGLPAVHGLIVLNDPATGAPTCVMDAAAITGARTAAVSGVAIKAFRPSSSTVAILGAGLQARTHLQVLRHLLAKPALRIFDRHEERAGRLAGEALSAAGFASAVAVGSAEEAVRGTDLVISVAALGSMSQALPAGCVEDDALVVAVDFATYVPADLARSAARFVVDDISQFLAYRDAGDFEGYPDPDASLGQFVGPVAGFELDGTLAPPPAAPHPRKQHVVVTHLGLGLLDVAFAHAVLQRAEAEGMGRMLER